MTTFTENYQQTLRQLKKKLLASRFLRWWLGELSAMVPLKLRPAGLAAESFIFVRVDTAEAVLSRLDSGQLHPINSVSLLSTDAATQRQAFRLALQQAEAGRHELAVVLPPASVLRKILTLPLATEENLRQVLEFQIEEHTPFTASQVYFGHRVIARNFERGQLSVEFVATPRGDVDEAVKTLTGWGTTVRAVVAEETLRQPPLLNLLPVASGKAPSVLLQGTNPWLAGLLVVLALAAMAAPVLVKRQAVVQLLPWVDKGRVEAEATDTLRRDLETKVDEHNFLLEKRQQLPPVIMALEELTRILPDDTWVQQLDIKGKELQIQGETASSVRLIGLFEQSTIFHDASFRSSLTKGQGIGTERYQLALKLLPMAQKPASSAAPALASAPAQAASAPAAAAFPASAPAPAVSASGAPAAPKKP